MFSVGDIGEDPENEILCRGTALRLDHLNLKNYRYKITIMQKVNLLVCTHQIAKVFKTAAILLLNLLLLIFCSCEQKAGSNTKTPSAKDSSSVTILLDHYVTNMKGNRKEVKTEAELSELLKSDHKRQDSLFILLGNSPVDRLEKVLDAVHHAGISKYVVIVTESFFTLPYPKE
jgi:biopolymer transport protein ExbD